jgi:3,4-dihydroxy-2-butanone 4-phosphate synthase
MSINRIVQEFEMLKNGKLVIIYDDVETEVGALMGLGECVTPENINLMTKVGKGLVYIVITREKAKSLHLTPMVEYSTSVKDKPFAISIDHKHCSTGISAFDRAATIQAFLDKETRAEDFHRPGHVFPLISRDGGLLERIGIAEAVIDLTRFFLSKPIAYTCEILNEDGNIASFEELENLSIEHGLNMIKVSELIDMKYQSTKWIQAVGTSSIKLESIEMNMYHIENYLYSAKIDVYMKKGCSQADNIIFYEENSTDYLVSLFTDKSNRLKNYTEELVKGEIDCLVYHRNTSNKYISVEKRNMIKKQIKHFIYNEVL